MKAMSALAIALAMAASAFAGIGKAQENTTLTLLSIKSGETLLVRVVTLVTATCDPLFLSFEGIDVLEGPQELSLKFEPGLVHTFTTARDCPKLVPGGTIMATAAKEIAERNEANLTFRVRYKTKQGPWQNTVRYRVLLFPSGEPAPATQQ